MKIVDAALERDVTFANEMEKFREDFPILRS